MFFYANAFGSRVYFDDLGPPWPKHPCTDNPRLPSNSPPTSSDSPTRRSRGQIHELITAANTAGRLNNKLMGQRRADAWTLLVVTSVARNGDTNIVRAEFLDFTNYESIEFRCTSAVPIFQIGDFISKKGNRYSFVYKETLAPVYFSADTVVDLTLAKVELPRPSEPQPPVRTVWNGGHRFKPKGKPRGKRKRETTNDDLRQFGSSASAQSEFCSTLRPVVKRLAREGTRKPGDVALRLEP